jgi:hypothetical protein
MPYPTEAIVQSAYAPATDSTTAQRSEPPEPAPLAELISRLSTDGSRLIQQELALAKAEVAEKAVELRSQVTALAIGGVILHTGALALTAGLVLLIAQLVAAWVAALFVGVALATLGAVLLLRGKSKLSTLRLRPDQAIANVERDVRTMQEAAHGR